MGGHSAGFHLLFVVGANVVAGAHQLPVVFEHRLHPLSVGTVLQQDFLVSFLNAGRLVESVVLRYAVAGGNGIRERVVGRHLRHGVRFVAAVAVCSGQGVAQDIALAVIRGGEGLGGAVERALREGSEPVEVVILERLILAVLLNALGETALVVVGAAEVLDGGVHRKNLH